MFTGPPVGVVQPFVPVGPGPGSDGWPREREREESAPQSWRHDRLDDSYAVVRRPPSRSSTPHHPSLSLNSSPSSGSGGSLSRNASLRGPGAESAKRPPREWRSDFSMTGPGLFGALLTRSRSRSFAGNDISYPKVVLNAYIRYTSSRPPMHLDLRRSPNTLKFRALDHPLSRWDLTRFACEPPLPHMRLFHAQLPWYIDVDLGTNPAGVTLFDVFSAIHMCMMTPIVFGDFYNNEMSNDLRDQIAAAWAERCTSAEERNRGVRRVDFLMGKVVMEGIQKGRDGLWEIKTRKIGL
ncbi:hypothetical protein BD413DRAFT_481826 [Trametes elegans]|nr:hypothetical protein BD413DRAFT_481826 [Trametes elegans]